MKGKKVTKQTQKEIQARYRKNQGGDQVTFFIEQDARKLLDRNRRNSGLNNNILINMALKSFYNPKLKRNLRWREDE